MEQQGLRLKSKSQVFCGGGWIRKLRHCESAVGGMKSWDHFRIFGAEVSGVFCGIVVSTWRVIWNLPLQAAVLGPAGPTQGAMMRSHLAKTFKTVLGLNTSQIAPGWMSRCSQVFYNTITIVWLGKNVSSTLGLLLVQHSTFPEVKLPGLGHIQVVVVLFGFFFVLVHFRTRQLFLT